MKKTISLLLATVFLLSSLTACGGTPTDAGSETPDVEVTEDGKVTLPISGVEVDASVFAEPQAEPTRSSRSSTNWPLSPI